MHIQHSSFLSEIKGFLHIFCDIIELLSAHNNKQQLQQTHSIGHHAAKRAFDRLDTSMVRNLKVTL